MKKDKQVFTYLRGGLGNQMFVYAAARAAQLRYYGEDGKIIVGYEKYDKEGLKDILKEFQLCKNIEFVSSFPLPFRIGLARKVCGLGFRFCKNPREIYNMANRLRRFAQFNGLIRCEDGFIPLPRMVPNKILMDAFFQSEQYFAEPNMQNVLQHDFSLAHPVAEENRQMIHQMESSESVCVAVRLGEYVKHPVHQVCTPEYYKKAIAIVREKKPNCKIFLFSDDIPMAMNMLGMNSEQVVCEAGTATAAETLFTMAHCKNFIISNSSFNWWAQYLSNSKNKIVIAPSRWYNTDVPCDIYQKDWTIVKV